MTRRNANLAVGAYGERVAARYLIEQGLMLLDHNWRCDVGEIDIVAREGACLVVCEVKTRRSEAFGSPIEAVTPVKAQRLRRLAGCWVRAHAGVEAARQCTDLRIDVVGVLRPTTGAPQITHLRGVVA